MQNLPDFIEIAQNAPDFPELTELFSRLPSTTCQRRNTCCQLLPDMGFAEAVLVLRAIRNQDPETGTSLCRNLLAHFLTNAVTITACPFFTGDGCHIYTHRMFGCRAYGIWPAATHAARAATDRAGRDGLAEQWMALGIRLPESVTGFSPGYCTDCTPHTDLESNALSALVDAVETDIRQLSIASFGEWEGVFRSQFGGDLSFLVATALFGMKRAVQEKFLVTREWVETGASARLSRLLPAADSFHRHLAGTSA